MDRRTVESRRAAQCCRRPIADVFGAPTPLPSAAVTSDFFGAAGVDLGVDHLAARSISD